MLDDALSALDAETEALVESNLREARRGRTTIVLSHHLTALMSADAIVVLEDGAVVDRGRHAELLERCSVYATAWARQHGARDQDGTEPMLALS